jgi:hypothetical protein
MIKVFLLILGPGSAWEKIAQSRRGYAFILTTYLLPFMILVTWLEGWGLLHWGKWQPRFQVNKMFTADQVIPFEIAQFLVFLVTIFICALIILRVSQTFHERNKYLEAFTLTAYGFSPVLLFHVLDVLPGISPWATAGFAAGSHARLRAVSIVRFCHRAEFGLGTADYRDVSARLHEFRTFLFDTGIITFFTK